jgi:hypothetical protein
MKAEILKIAGVKSEKDFYKKFPTEESFMAKYGKQMKKLQQGGATAMMNKLAGSNAFAAGVQSLGDVVSGVQDMKSEKENMLKSKQMAGVSNVGLQASMTRPEQVQKKYVRPEDNINTGQEFFPIYGTGTVLAKNGTEIANTFAPNTIYTDLEEAQGGIKLPQFKTNPDFMKIATGKNAVAGQQSDIFNFAEQGGGNALAQVTAGLGSPKGYGVTGAGKIGGGIGSVAGTLLGGPVGGMIGKFAGQTLGNLVGSGNVRKTKQFDDTTAQNVGAMALNQDAQGLQQQNYAYMRDGGMANPQVATSLEGIPLTRLFAPDPTMDTLRAGGHLKSYTPPSERAMYTGREQFAMGGDLETHWGGYAEPMSYNPYLPDGGETVMFRGKSHDESDGKGNTGIGITYGDSPVEVERGEPAVQLRNGSDGDNSLTVYGNLEIPSFGASLIGDEKAKGKKFKNYVADLSKTEQKQNKIVEKSTEELDNLEVITPQDLLSFESQKANILGANMKLKDIAKKKQDLASLQSAINDTAEEYGFEADALAKGKVKQAKKGASIDKAQFGNRYKYINPSWNQFDKNQNQWQGDAESTSNYYQRKEAEPETKPKKTSASNKKIDRKKVESINVPANILEDLRNKIKDRTGLFSPIGVPESVDKAGLRQRPVSNAQGSETGEEEFNWMNIANQILPYLRPSDAEALDPRQLSGEMLALAQNQLEPVQAQTFQPQLATPYDISLQDVINKNEADYRAAQRMMGYNPAALAALNAQKYQANQQVLGEQFRMNQAMRDKVYTENRNLLNQSNLQNLGILDQQYGRQQEALSNTKATAQAALNSISAKYLQNQAENRELQTYENLYNYRFDPRFRAGNMNPLAQFALQGSGMDGGSPYANLSSEEYKMLALQQELIEKQKQKLEKSNKPKPVKNGALVKAIKSM